MSFISKLMFKGSERNCYYIFIVLGGGFLERLEVLVFGFSGLGWIGCWIFFLIWELFV